MRTVEGGDLLVSGNSPGADQAYARGGGLIDPSRVELCLPYPGFEHTQFRPTIIEAPDPGYGENCYSGNVVRIANRSATKDHWRIASWMLPSFERQRTTVQQLYVRNVMMLLGADGEVADSVIAWPDREKKGWGGTGHTMRCARYLKIPVWLAELGRWWAETEATG